MIIYVSFDSSFSKAPPGFYTAVNAAVEFVERELINPIQVTIDFGWGEVGGQALAADALGESGANGVNVSYSQVREALTSAATSPDALTAVASLPANDPTNGTPFFVTDGLAEALGLQTDGSQVAGFVGMASDDPFTFDPYNRAVPGDFDAIGTMEHEITEVLGRIAGSGVVFDGVKQYSPLDLFRYNGPGELQLTPGSASFSINGGQTLLLPFNNPSFSDAGDWSTAVVGDSFGEGTAGIEAAVSPTDLEVMNVLGYQLAPDPTARNDFNANGVSDFLIENTAGTVVVGQDIKGSASFSNVTGLGPEWKFVADGDFLGSGSDQFLIENASGAVVDGQEVAGGKETFTTIGGLGSEWKFVGVGDFLGDDYNDQFLIENTSGAVVVGNAISGTAVYTQITGLGPEWKFVGAGNFLGTGPSEFMIENTSGAVVIGQVVNNAAVFTQVTGLGPEWKFVGDGDFLNNGQDQFLIENTAGAVDVGQVANGSVTFTQITSLGPEWSFVGTGDYFGEGHDSFLIENTSGAVVVGDDVGGHIQFTQIAGLGPEWVFH
jgi:hypothetical protein